MSNFFLSGGGTGDLDDGTADLFLNSVKLNDSLANLPLRLNSNKRIVSSKLSITDTTDLEEKLQTKYSLNFVNQTAVPVPPAGEISLYSKTDKNLYFKNELGAETKIGGGDGSNSMWNFPVLTSGSPASVDSRFLNGG